MNIYQSALDLIATYVYGGTLTAGSPEELTAVILATCGCVFCVALPFIVVFKFIQWACRI